MDIQFRHVTHAGDVCSSDGGREREWGGREEEGWLEGRLAEARQSSGQPHTIKEEEH